MKTIKIETRKVKASFELAVRTIKGRYKDEADYLQLSGDSPIVNNNRSSFTINGCEYTGYFTAKLIVRDTRTVAHPRPTKYTKTMQEPCKPYETASVIIQNLQRVWDWSKGGERPANGATAYAALQSELEPLVYAALTDKVYLAEQRAEELQNEFDRKNGEIEAANEKLAKLKNERDILYMQVSSAVAAVQYEKTLANSQL